MNTTAAQQAQPHGWFPRFSLRSLIFTVGVLGLALGCVGNFLWRVRHQRRIVAAIEAAGGKVRYNYQFGAGADLDLDFAVDYTVGTLSETPDGRYKRTRVTSAGTFHEVETPPGPKFMRRLFGDDAFAYVEDVSFRSYLAEPPGKIDPRLLLELPQLKALWLSRHQVSDEWLDAVARAPHLRHLVLSGDSASTATGAGVKRLSTASRLELLVFTGEWVRDDTIAGARELRQLKSVSLSIVPNVTSAVFSNLGELTNLRELTILRAQGIDDLGTGPLSKLQNMRILDLAKTSISDATLAHLSGLAELQSLNLTGTKIGDLGMRHLAGLSALKRLSLRVTNVGDTGLDVVSRLPRLRYLDLTGTGITDASAPVLARMTQLETLDMSSTSVTDEGILQLRALKNLKQLSIGPHISNEADAELRKALPDCRIQTFDGSGD